MGLERSLVFVISSTSNVHQCIKHLRSILQMGEVGPYRSLRLVKEIE